MNLVASHRAAVPAAAVLEKTTHFNFNNSSDPLFVHLSNDTICDWEVARTFQDRTA